MFVSMTTESQSFFSDLSWLSPWKKDRLKTFSINGNLFNLFFLHLFNLFGLHLFHNSRHIMVKIDRVSYYIDIDIHLKNIYQSI